MMPSESTSTARTERLWDAFFATVLVGGWLAGALLLWAQFGGFILGAGLECETAAQCERLAANQKTILRTLIPYTVVAVVALAVLVFGYNLYTGAGPGAVSERGNE